MIVNFSAPKWFASGYYSAEHELLDGYTHSIRAVGGYWSAKVTLSLDEVDIEDWFTNGLGRHVEVYDETIKIWEGFVDSISYNSGIFSAQQGPFLDIRNRINIKYTPVDNSIEPPVRGVETTTGVSNDTDSQDLYGIRVEVLSTGDMTDAQAEQVRDTYLEEHKNPVVSQDISSSAASSTNIVIDCVGYVRLLDWPYSNTGTGTVTASARVTDVLGDDPELTWVTTFIDTNSVTVDAYDNDNVAAWSAIQDALAHGGSSNERWIFQVLNNLTAYYQAAPTTLEYQVAISDPSLSIRKMTGEVVDPSRIEAGKWILVSDFLPGAIIPSTLREDPRALFIEEVSFTAPNTYTIRGGKFDRLPQLLKNLGIGGIGA